MSFRQTMGLGVLALSSLVMTGPAPAAFTMAINGQTVAVDNGSGDTNTATGVILYTGTYDGYVINFLAYTSAGPTVADITISQLSITNSGRSARPIEFEITSSGLTLPETGSGSYDLTATLIRDQGQASGPSGMVRMTGAAETALGGVFGSTPEIRLSGPALSGTETSQIHSTSSSLMLTEKIRVNGLPSGNAVTIRSTLGVWDGGDVQEVLTAPAPPTWMLSMAGLPFIFIGLWKMRTGQNNRTPPTGGLALEGA